MTTTMISLDSDKLRLTDFMDLPTLQEIQDSFAAVANVKATITDADGNVITSPTPTNEFLRRQKALLDTAEQSLAAEPGVRSVHSVRMRWMGHRLHADVEPGAAAPVTPPA